MASTVYPTSTADSIAFRFKSLKNLHMMVLLEIMNTHELQLLTLMKHVVAFLIMPQDDIY